jgi:hypothetical protein
MTERTIRIWASVLIGWLGYTIIIANFGIVVAIGIALCILAFYISPGDFK